MYISMHGSKNVNIFLQFAVRGLHFFTLNAISKKIHFRGLDFKDFKVIRCMLSVRHCSIQLQKGPVCT